MYIRIAFLFLVLGSLLVPSCKKDKNESTPENDLPLNTLQFKADGQEYSFSSVFGLKSEESINGIQVKVFTINALDLVTQDNFQLWFYYANSTPPEAGVVYESSGSSCAVSNGSDTCPLMSFIPASSGATYSSSGAGAKAYVKFSVLELDGGVAKGEFTATLIKDTGGSVEITEGLFHITVL